MRTRSTEFVKAAREAVKKLRGAAAYELDSTTSKKVEPKFDEHRDTTVNETDAADEFDRENGVARYPGQNIEHIGNGSGGVR